MPRLLRARRPQDAEEKRKVNRLAGSRHAPGDWILRARSISLSWQGLRNAKIAEELGCHPKTVRKSASTASMRGALPPVSEIAHAPRAQAAPHTTGTLEDHCAGRQEPPRQAPHRARWCAPRGGRDQGSLLDDAGCACRGCTGDRHQDQPQSQVRRILLHEGVRWRKTRPWAQSCDPEFVPKGQGSLSSTPIRHRTPQWSAWTSSALSLREPFLRLRDGRRTPHKKAPLEYSRGPDKVWVFGALRESRTANRSRSPPAHETPRAT